MSKTYQSLKKKQAQLQTVYGINTVAWHEPEGMFFSYGGGINIKTRKNPLHYLTDLMFDILNDLRKRFSFRSSHRGWTWILRNASDINSMGFACMPFVKSKRNERFFCLGLSLGSLEYFELLRSYRQEDLNYLVGWKLFDFAASAETNRRKVTAAIIRHEFAHLLTKPKHLRVIERLQKVYSHRWWTSNVSKYVMHDSCEAMAEVFSKVTDPDYKWGSLPSALETVVLDMLECSKLKQLRYVH